MAASESRARERMTLEEFRALNESDEYLLELDDGVLIREPRPKRPHGTAVILLGRHLAEYALEHGGIVTTETGIVLQEDPPRVYGPDLSCYREDPVAYGDRSGWITRAPDLVVEVISPSNRAADLKRKIGRYFEAGTAEVWIVYPESRSLEVHRPDGRIRALTGEEAVTSEILPGFRLAVSEIFRF
ncbi:MAG TPA: Uma2 family endonuclease [Gemmatimonadota bacterium]|nr:Uma2 family endonuclease [Gemmatimonadota bacterium]